MRTTHGFVAVTAAGEFLRLVGYSAHLGTRYELLPVDELEDATVQPYAGFGRGDKISLPDGAHWVPVTVRREVVLAGWGVDASALPTPVRPAPPMPPIQPSAPECSTLRQDAGLAYPRTCMKCGKGPCRERKE